MKKLIILIFLALTAEIIVGCSTPTIPKFPEITCIPTKKLSDKQLGVLAQCRKDMELCSVPRNTLLQIHENYQNKSACLEQFRETSEIYK